MPARAATLSLALVLSAGCGSTGATRPGIGSEQNTTHPAGVIASTVSLAGRPHGVAIASSGRFCVSQIDAASVTCGTLTASNATFQGSIAVGPQPAHVALSPDGTQAYTANQAGSSLSIANVDAATAVTVPFLSEGFNVLADRDGSRVYVTTSSGTLQVVDVGTRTVVAQVTVGAASNGLALDRTAGLLYVSSIVAGSIVAVSTTTNTVVRTYAVSASPQRIALSPDGKKLYVANESSGLDILDVTTGARTLIPGVDSQAVGLALSPDGKVVYVTNPPRGELQIIDAATLQVTTLAGLASPRNVAFGLSGKAALVTAEGNKLYVIR